MRPGHSAEGARRSMTIHLPKKYVSILWLYIGNVHIVTKKNQIEQKISLLFFLKLNLWNIHIFPQKYQIEKKNFRFCDVL